MSENWQENSIGQSRDPRKKIKSMGKLTKKSLFKRGGKSYRCLGLDENWRPIMEPVDSSSEAVVRRNSGANLFSSIPQKLESNEKPAKKRKPRRAK